MAKNDLNDMLKQRMAASQQASELSASDDAYQKIFQRSPPAEGPVIKDLPLESLIPFYTADIGFHPYPRQKLQAFSEQLAEVGLLERIIVRQTATPDTYEILAGHNRTEAAKLAGWKTIPAEVVDADDSRAIVIATSTNLLRRQDLTIIERGKAYKALLDAQRKQGFRSDLTSGERHQKFLAREVVAEFFGVTEYEIRKAIKLTSLIPELQYILENEPKTLSLACALLIADYARLHCGGRLPVLVNFCLDEYCNIGYMEGISDVFNSVRGFNMACQVVVQSLSQWQEKYPGKDWENQLGTFDQTLYLGCNDITSAKYISEKCGKVTIAVTNNQMPLAPLFSSVYSTTRPYSQTKSSTQRDLMQPDEILRLDRRKCIALFQSRKPQLEAMLKARFFPEGQPMRDGWLDNQLRLLSYGNCELVRGEASGTAHLCLRPRASAFRSRRAETRRLCCGSRGYLHQRSGPSHFRGR